MSENTENKEELNEEQVENVAQEEVEATAETQEETQQEVSELEKVKAELAEQKDKYLRLYSEFDNFRKRTNKEKADLIATAGERLLLKVLPVVDDFERAEKSNKEVDDAEKLKEGFQLIYDKFGKILEAEGLKAINATGEEFDADLHEALTQIPSPSEEMKGKVIDEIERGYYLGEKVIRFSKVVVGA
ncbi:MAG: nucleotide exchange factor GrpE [Cytophagales bacterium]|nr:nucleotide exchange factor GrpE [Cytophagales bacterium]